MKLVLLQVIIGRKKVINKGNRSIFLGQLIIFFANVSIIIEWWKYGFSIMCKFAPC